LPAKGNSFWPQIETRGFRSHPVFGPEAGQENRFREGANGLEIIFQKYTFVGEVIQDRVARSIREPGTIDDESCRERPDRFSANDSDEHLPLLIGHGLSSLAKLWIPSSRKQYAMSFASATLSKYPPLPFLIAV
jgi:hypothetical protein